MRWGKIEAFILMFIGNLNDRRIKITVECAPADAKYLGGARLVTARLCENELDIAAVEFFERRPVIGKRHGWPCVCHGVMGGSARLDVFGKIADSDEIARA